MDNDDHFDRDNHENDEEYSDEETSEDEDEDDDDDLDESGLPKNQVEFQVDYNREGKSSHRGAGVVVMGPQIDIFGSNIDSRLENRSMPPVSVAPKIAPLIIKRPQPLIAKGFYGARSNWNVSDDLSCKPDFYELEQTATFVPNTRASIIGSRISDCLRDLSIHCNYDDVNAKLDASTEDSAQFQVQLYAGKGDFNHGTIVEVMKRRGTANNYHEIISSIFKSSQGQVISKVFKLNIDDIDFGEFGIDINDEESRQNSLRTIKICSDMIQEGSSNGVVLGLERLSTLVDSAKLGTAAALRNSEILLQSEQGEFIRNTIATLIEHKRLPRGPIDFDVYEANRIRKLSYVILSNTLRALFDKGRLSDIFAIGVHNWFVEDLIGFLVQDIKCAEENPHEAYMASSCLVSVVKVHEGAMKNAQELGASVALSFAQSVGNSCHKRLSDQTTAALEILAE